MKKPSHGKLNLPAGLSLIPDGSTISVDWPSLTKSLVNVVAQGVATILGRLDGASEVLSSVIDAASSARIEVAPGERAWELFCLSFAWAFDELRLHGQGQDKASESAVMEAISEAKKCIKGPDQIMPQSFLSNPSSLPIYKLIRDKFVDLQIQYRNNPGEDSELLRFKFDAAFNRAVLEIWSNNTDVFLSIQSYLQSPGMVASSRYLEWSKYRAYLWHQFHVQPTFGMERNKISLSQLHVSLRGVWKEEIQRKSRNSLDNDSAGAFQVHMCDLLEALEVWIRDRSSREVITLIGGSPGSGKSTTLKALAARLSQQEEVHLLLIPLQHINLDKDLRGSVEEYFVSRTHGIFRHNPISRDAIEARHSLILLFDGLDELALPGKPANETASLFMTKLVQLVAALQGETQFHVKIVVTGRLPSFNAARTFGSISGQRSIQVIGFTPFLENFDDNFRESGKYHILCTQDQRAEWWRKYAQAVGLSQQPPQALKDARLRSLTDEPLLCYLLALSGYAVDNWEEAAENRNRIYEKLLDAVWERGWGEGGRQGAGHNLNLDDFNALMESIAFAAWLGGDTKVATETGFKAALSKMNTESAWNNFQQDNGPDITNLAMNFYLNNSDIEKRGFEFTHKSFGDYLAARAILSIARSILKLDRRWVENAGQIWFGSTSSGITTREIANFLRDEIRLSISKGSNETALKLKLYFEELASLSLKIGLDSKQNSQNWSEQYDAHMRSEVTLWSVLNATALAIGQTAPDQARVAIVWPNSESFRELLSRQRRQGYLAKMQEAVHPDNPIFESSNSTEARSKIKIDADFTLRDCLAFLDAKNADLFEAYLHEADLRHADLRGANLSGAHLCNANMTGANISGARLERTHMDGCNLTGVTIEDCNFYDSRIRGVKFTDEQLKKTKFSLISIVDLLGESDPSWKLRVTCSEEYLKIFKAIQKEAVILTSSRDKSHRIPPQMNDFSATLVHSGKKQRLAEPKVK